MTFHIDRHELNRRMKAYSALCLTWLVLQTFITITLPQPQQLILGVYTASLALVLLIIWVLVAYFFYKRYTKVRVHIKDGAIKRITTKATYTYPLRDITAIHTVMTTRGTIRQVSIATQAGGHFNFDGLHDFEAFKTQITSLCPKAHFKTITEPLDYDHVLFYPILGILFSISATFLTLSVYSFTWLTHFLGPALLLFSTAVGLFFAGIRPVARQYGAKAALVDYLIAAAMFIAIIALIVI